jgi:hypothetical protein
MGFAKRHKIEIIDIASTVLPALPTVTQVDEMLLALKRLEGLADQPAVLAFKSADSAGSSADDSHVRSPQ